MKLRSGLFQGKHSQPMVNYRQAPSRVSRRLNWCWSGNARNHKGLFAKQATADLGRLAMFHVEHCDRDKGLKELRR